MAGSCIQIEGIPVHDGIAICQGDVGEAACGQGAILGLETDAICARAPWARAMVNSPVCMLKRMSSERTETRKRQTGMTDETYPAAGTNSRSHLGAGSRIMGELYFPGTVELPGYVKGRVDASAIVIEQAGEVDGELRAASVTIKGRFRGQIIGGKVALHASARVTGKITYESLSIERGAQVEGVCRRRPYSGGAKPVD